MTLTRNSNRNKSEDSHSDDYSEAGLDGQKQENMQTDQSDEMDLQMSEPFS